MSPDVSLLSTPPPAALPLEIVERKGVGHPDTICDAIVEQLSVDLSRAYLDRFGSIQHHNVDKGLLWGGAARPAFGGGEICAPIELHVGGRATMAMGGTVVPVDEIAIEGARAWLRAHLRFLDPERHVRVVPHLRPTSPELTALFRCQARDGVPLANDTSFGVGFAPLDELEQVVLAVERRLNSASVKHGHPAIGEDVKVMGARRGAAIAITVACAIVDRHVATLADYVAVRESIRALALDAARDVSAAPLDVQVNTADGDTWDRVYLTVTGLSAESGDDGQVGRGNRLNGLITPYRPMSLEAVAGKNPVTHVGKLYNVVADRAARAVVADVPGVVEAQCFLLSRVGRPIAEPQVFEVKVRLVDPGALAALAPRIAERADAELARIQTVWRDAVEGRLQVW
jgi:S-adenosylmethionine synthetase